MTRHVDTEYGPVPGCPDCGVIPLRGIHLCEHGVTSAPEYEMSFTIEFDAGDLYTRIMGRMPDA